MPALLSRLVRLLPVGARKAPDAGWDGRFLPHALRDARGDCGRANPVRDFCW